MTPHWPHVQSFQQSQELLSAINTLSIHRKLKDGGHPDTNRIEAAEQAKEALIAFFDKLDHVAQNIEDGHPTPVLGVDSRFIRLAENYVDAKHARGQSASPFFERPLSQVEGLFYSERTRDRSELLEILAAFRVLLEEHVGADTKWLLADI
ncbi:MAG: hypothetical protein OYM47_00680 [Gemmatimonadota bacterium]|nr:hypothetical protein [Gemmatimonadota bacterium]